MFKPVWKLMGVTAAVVLMLVGTAPGEETVRKAATVNGTVIGVDALDQALAGFQRQMLQQGRTIPDEVLGQVRGRLLDQLIDQELLYQESRKQEIAVDEAGIQARLDRMRAEFASPEDFEKALAGTGVTLEQFGDRLRRQAAVSGFIEQRIVSQVTVPGDAAKAFYEAHPEYFTRPEQVRARHILIRTADDADAAGKKAARERLEEIRRKLNDGADFAALAREYSQDPGSKEKGGDLGFFGRGRMVEAFEQAAFALADNEISPVVETDFGFHLIQVTGHRAAEKRSLEGVEPQIVEHLKQERIRERVQGVVETLRKAAEIEKFI